MPKRSVMSHNFTNTPRANIARSSFDRSHGYKTTFDVGGLIPFYVDEALPGDTFNYKMTAFARLATPIKPIMDNMFMETFFFSVPVRQIWVNWVKFNGEQINPGESTDFVVPTMQLDGTPNVEGSIYDYMGIPTSVNAVVNVLHLRAYAHIYNHWFRDQNLQTSIQVPTGDGPDDPALYSILKRRKRPDYFTSCLPFPQKGDPVTVPISGILDVVPTGVDAVPVFKQVGGGNNITLGAANGDDNAFWSPQPDDPTAPAAWERSELVADLTDAVGVNINEMRESFQVQRLLERDARGGTRYPEILQAHFGVTDPSMLVHQRPEYLGGGSSPININPVQQTSESDITGPDASPQGNLAAFGTVTLQNHGFTKSFTEHCLLIGIVNVRADLTYQQALNRMWSRQTRFDYYWPALAHLGEQSVLNKELAAFGGVEDEQVFGFQERYAEYRYKPSLITGKFRSEFAESLDVWHLSEQFSITPVLNQDFIVDNTPLDRCIAVEDEPHFLFDSYTHLRCARPMPLYGTPGMIDHF